VLFTAVVLCVDHIAQKANIGGYISAEIIPQIHGRIIDALLALKSAINLSLEHEE
jgi:hypothetical protein